MNSAEIFNEAVSIVPWIHTPVTQARSVLIVGPSARAAGDLALRFGEVLKVSYAMVAPQDVPRDNRARPVAGLDRIDGPVDLAVVAVPNVTPELLVQLRRLVPSGVVCIAVDQFARAAAVRRLMQPYWKHQAIYREHLPEPAAFVLASDQPISRKRSVPWQSQRYTDKYIPALFLFSRDEMKQLFGKDT